MRLLLTRQSIVIGLAWLLVSTATFAQTSPTNPPTNPMMGPGPGRPDLSGYWTGG